MTKIEFFLGNCIQCSDLYIYKKNNILQVYFQRAENDKRKMNEKHSRAAPNHMFDSVSAWYLKINASYEIQFFVAYDNNKKSRTHTTRSPREI